MKIEEKFKNKNKKMKEGDGFLLSRRRTTESYGILMHSTNGNFGSEYESEVRFLYNTTRDVCAHFIIGKKGQITQLLPVEMEAWHAGRVNDVYFANNNSIGIEQHFTPGEDTNLPLLEEAAKELIHYLMYTYPIYGVQMHRKVAIFENGSLGRKPDPSFQTDIQFRYWLDTVYSTFIPKTIKKGAQLYTAPDIKSQKATHITDSFIEKGIFTTNYATPIKYQTNGWVWIPTGIGFVETKALL
jgi:N-acetyl-anhydromuramyl-L-alanine amidase AmpD